MLNSNKTAIKEETIIHYLLPLASCYLFNDEYGKHNHLLDATYESLQAIARCLSWPNYEKLLRFYLANMTRKIEYQKQCVKAVVAILNGFHFDLTNSKFKSYYALKADEKLEAQLAEAPKATEVTEATEETSIPVESVAGSNEEETKQDEVEPELPEMTLEEEEKPVLNNDRATKIHSIIATQLLPELNKVLTARSNREKQHKSLKQDHYPEDDEILRVPIALALVNLLKNLPPGALERSLPGYNIDLNYLNFQITNTTL